MEDAISHERRAVIGTPKCLHFLVKSELPHSTNFSGLLDLAIALGCDYLKHLRQGSNVSYDLIKSLLIFSIVSMTVLMSVFWKIHESASITQMIDEYTDIAILKKSVVYGRGVVKGELECNFLDIKDLADGTAMSIETYLGRLTYCVL